MPITKGQYKQLKPYLLGERPAANGEWDMHCPFHADENRSTSLNVQTDEWYCFACARGYSSISALVRALGMQQADRTSADPADLPVPLNADVKPAATAKQVRRLRASRLRNRRTAALARARGISVATLDAAQVGWSVAAQAYTIPVLTADGMVRNLRHYQLNPDSDRRKIWSVAGHGSNALYPIDQLKHDTIVITEGEWDALATLDRGISAITKTGGAKAWSKNWNSLFAGKHVIVCHDMDTVGQAANNKVANNLKGIAASVRIVQLPYDIQDDSGKDLTDFWLEDHTVEDFWALVPPLEPVVAEPAPQVDVSVLDSFNSEHYGRPLGMRVTITGKSSGGYIVPKVVNYTCTLDAGKKCDLCPMQEWGGLGSLDIHPSDPLVLKIIQSTEKQRNDTLREHSRIANCNSLTIDFDEVHSVERLSVRTSVDAGGSSSHVNRQVVSVGRHDTMPNTTVQMEGRIHLDPRD